MLATVQLVARPAHRREMEYSRSAHSHAFDVLSNLVEVPFGKLHDRNYKYYPLHSKARFPAILVNRASSRRSHRYVPRQFRYPDFSPPWFHRADFSPPRIFAAGSFRHRVFSSPESQVWSSAVAKNPGGEKAGFESYRLHHYTQPVRESNRFFVLSRPQVTTLHMLYRRSDLFRG